MRHQPGQCQRIWHHSYGKLYRCNEPVVPGTNYCAEHLIEKAHRVRKKKEVKDNGSTDRTE
jgi:hypothetical protein